MAAQKACIMASTWGRCVIVPASSGKVRLVVSRLCVAMELGTPNPNTNPGPSPSCVSTRAKVLFTCGPVACSDGAP